MKTITLAAIAMLVGTAAQAQDPAYGGSGVRAGGPAYRLNSETGGPVKRSTKTPTSAAYRYSGIHAGGPAADLNAGGTGALALQGTVADPTRVVPFGTSRSGHTAGGPYRQ